MKAPWSLRPWTSLSEAPVSAVELLRDPGSAADLPSVLGSMGRTGLKGAAFLIVGVATGTEFKQVLEACNASRLSTRLCIAVGRSCLSEIDVKAIDGDHVGLMLDEVDAEISLAELVFESLEAVRFRSEFIAQASGSLRLGCALSAVLGLAHDLGLMTLGPVTVPNEDWLVPGVQFDYVPAHLEESRAGPARMRSRAHGPAAARRTFQFSR